MAVTSPSFSSPGFGPALSRASGGSISETAYSIGTNGRSYSTVTLWEADLDNAAQYPNGNAEVGEMYNDSAFDEQPVFNGGGQLAPPYIALRAASGERHTGVAGSGARNVLSSKADAVTYYLQSTDFYLKGIELDDNGQKTSNTSNNCCGILQGTFNTYVEQCLVHGVYVDGAGVNTVGIQINPDNPGDYQVLNSIIYHLSRGGTGGLHTLGMVNNAGAGAEVSKLYNLTIHDIQNDKSTRAARGLHGAGGSDNYIRNILITDCINTGGGTQQCFYTSMTFNTASNNASSDATALGSNVLTAIASANQYVSTTVGSEDLHLKAGADCLDAGTPINDVVDAAIDIDEQDRVGAATWDIGAHEYEL